MKMYDISALKEKHRACLDDMAKHFESFFRSIDYSRSLPKQVRVRQVRSHIDLQRVLRGPGFYCIASTIPTSANRCTLRLGERRAPVVYRGHSHTVRERVESHLFNEPYVRKDAGRRFTVCLKLDGQNINVDRGVAAGQEWLVATHSMPKSNFLVREAAEVGFDLAFGRPVGSDLE